MNSSYQQEKIMKLKRMRLVATGLLGFMLLIFVIFKRFESYNIFFSSIVAFSEAAMIGALADWFAVVALFRHPLGISWIPHTAIIQKNKDRIGESLSDFVVSNFFTEDIIKGKLKSVHFSDTITLYVKKNKDTLSQKIRTYLPELLQFVLQSDRLSESIHTSLKNKLKSTELYPLFDSILPPLIASEFHIPMIKQLLANSYNWISENKEKTLSIIEGMNRTLALPIVGDIVYRSIVKTLSKLHEDMENGITTEFSKEVLHNLPDRLVKELKTSKKAKEKVEELKNNILESDLFNSFVKEKIESTKEEIVTYSQNAGEELSEKLLSVLDSLLEDLLRDDSIREKIDVAIKEGIVYITCSYRNEIAGLIRETVENWPMEDMVDKLETQVGGDLQFIRINGTVIGGLAGLAIHILSLLF